MDFMLQFSFWLLRIFQVKTADLVGGICSRKTCWHGEDQTHQQESPLQLTDVGRPAHLKDQLKFIHSVYP